MSTEYIQAVSIREGQVYLTSKSNNDDLPYHTWHCEGLSKVYKEEGQLGLDREILRMLCEYAVLKGSHPSITKYREALEAPESEEIFQEAIRASNAAYSLLSPEDKKYLHTSQSAAAQAYQCEKRKLQDQKYTALARLCQKSQK